MDDSKKKKPSPPPPPRNLPEEQPVSDWDKAKNDLARVKNNPEHIPGQKSRKDKFIG